jgi:GT2 family glycosyltransferase
MTVPASAPLCIVPAHLRSPQDADHLLRCLLALQATAPAAADPTRCPVSSALMLIRHDVLDELGPLDEGMKAGLEDVDLCLRAFLAGHEAIYEPRVTVTRLGIDERRRSKRLREWADGSAAWMSRKWAAADFSPFVMEAL